MIEIIVKIFFDKDNCHEFFINSRNIYIWEKSLTELLKKYKEVENNNRVIDVSYEKGTKYVDGRMLAFLKIKYRIFDELIQLFGGYDNFEKIIPLGSEVRKNVKIKGEKNV